MYTNSELILDIRTACRISDTDVDWTTSRLLSIATRELRSNVAPWLLSLRDSFYVKYIDTPLIASRARYPISSRSIGSTLHNLKLVDSQGVESVLTHKTISTLSNSQLGRPTDFYLEGNVIRLNPAPSDNSYSLRQYINAKPSKLVDDQRKATIVSLAGMIATVEYSSGMSAGAVNNTRVDVIAGYSPCDILYMDQLVTAVDDTITFPANLPLEISVGDIICFAGEATSPQIPEELAPALLLCVEIVYFKSMDYATQLANAAGNLTQIKQDLMPIYSSRIEGAPKQISSSL